MEQEKGRSFLEKSAKENSKTQGSFRENFQQEE